MKEKYLGKPITKDLTNRKLSGVCSGIAQHYNCSVNIIRISSIIFGIMFPMAAVFGYLLASLLMPTNRY